MGARQPSAARSRTAAAALEFHRELYRSLYHDATTLVGGGTLTLQNAARVRGSGTLFNGGPNGEAFTIQGETSNSGSLGSNELAIVNRSGGIIDANNATGLQLVVDPRANGGLINLGLMQASGGGVSPSPGTPAACSTTPAA